jgi:hypothetical protein
MPNQRLLDAMEEIKPILRKHDCAAIVLLASEDHMEFLYELSPTWSAAKLEPDGKLRVRALASMYPDKETHKKTVERTTGIFLGFLDLLEKSKRDMLAVAKLLGSKFDISHWSREERPPHD